MTGFYLFLGSIIHVLLGAGCHLASVRVHRRRGSSEQLCSYIASHLMLVAFQKNFFFGTQAALDITGTHGRPNVKVESAPAAIPSLSAACRCASHPPSNPSVLPPEIRTQSAMAGFPRFLRLLFISVL